MASPEALYEKLKHIHVGNPLCEYTYERCIELFPIIEEISILKEEKNALILAHTYVHPDIVFGVADHVGDSYGLAKAARQTQASIILFPAVRFMAETAKLLNPDKLVLDPNPNGGCSLADSIDPDTVWRLRRQYPQHTFVCYINTTAAVKAACDVCVTSSNAHIILEKIPNDRIYFLPDRLLAENTKNRLLKRGITKEILSYPGSCYVHEEIQEEEIDLMRYRFPDVTVLAHPECPPEVVQKADVVGSTTEMHRYVVAHQHQRSPFFLLTECGVASRLQIDAPHAKLVGGCHLCKYMRSNSLQSILAALKQPKESDIITIEPQIQERARRCIERMFDYAE
ncbi:MAG: quinolinate synthase NadA [Chlamydiia bacterium]|nr:quinolinate synthase NadA [Chlamydiia bacterium]